MNLQQSFKKRNKLQEEIANLRRMLNTTALIRESDESENTLLLNGMTCQQWLNLIAEKTAQLTNLCIAIDKANEIVKPLLTELSICKAQKAFYDNVNDCIVRAPTKRYYAETDKTIYYQLNLRQTEILESINSLTKKIERLEEKIQKLNATTPVLVEE